MEKLEELYEQHGLYHLLGNQKKTYIRKSIDIDLQEKISYRVNSKDWVVYLDGNTIRKFVRGIAFCSSGISFCDDNGNNIKVPVDELSRISVSNTAQSIIINGKIITLGEISISLVEKIKLIKRSLSEGNDIKVNQIRLANLGEEVWYVGYINELSGPFSKEELQRKIDDSEYDLDLMQVWNRHLENWVFIKEIDDFSIANLHRRKLSNDIVQIDVNFCSADELLSLPGINREKVNAFLDRRKAGIYLKNIYEFQMEFQLKPHEVESLKNMVLFKIPEVHHKNCRILDI